MPRVVVLLFGPPGAGKSTAARELAAMHGLTVYDQDDPRWSSQKAFTSAVRALASTGSARAVVIRSGATSSSRSALAHATRATHGYLLDPGAEVCVRRVRVRRTRTPGRNVPGVRSWYQQRETADGIPSWPGAAAALDPSTWTPAREYRKRMTPGERAARYDAYHRTDRKVYGKRLAAGPLPCVWCGKPIHPGQPWDLEHGDDAAPRGPAHPGCNRAAGARNANKARARRRAEIVAASRRLIL